MRKLTLPALLLLLPGLALAQTPAPRALSGADILSVLPTGPGGVPRLDGTGKLPLALIPPGSGGIGPAGPQGPVGPAGPAGSAASVPLASTTTPGLMKPGAGLLAAPDGTVSVDSQVPPSASIVPTLAATQLLQANGSYLTGVQFQASLANTPGTFKCGAGLLCGGDGTVSVDSQVPAAASSVPALADLRVLLQDGSYLTGQQLKTVMGVP